MEEKEIWKVFKDTRYAPKGALWEISDQGRVKKNGEIYECKLNKGYKIFGCNYAVHRAVAALFIPNPENKPCVDHINGNPLDNRAKNLRWVTHKENSNNPITKRRQSEVNKGPNNPMYKKPQSEETKKKRSKSMKNKNKGKILGPQSEEHRKNISEGMKRYWQNKKY